MFYKKLLKILFFVSLVLLVFSDKGLADQDTTEIPQDSTELSQDTTSVPEENGDEREIISEDFANRLKSQLNLTDEQTDRIKSVIASYIDSYNDDSNDSAGSDDQVLLILDDVQRASWESVKDGFWNDLNRRLNSDDNEEEEQ